MKTIPLTRGQTALVDDADYAWLSQWKWHAHRATVHETWYARRRAYLGGGRKGARFECVLMHRLLLGLRQGDGVKTDHRDGNGLNNQRANLRVCDNKQSASNRRVWRTSPSGFKGVWSCKDKDRPPGWVARIQHDGRCLYIGKFKAAEDAARAYDAAALKLHGTFARTNAMQGLL